MTSKKPASVPQQWVHVWCGRLDFLMHRRHTKVVDTIAFDLRMEWVAVSVDEQVQAVIDRQRMSRWLDQPTQPLVVDAVALAVTDGRLLLFVGHDWCVEVPNDIDDSLNEHI